MLDEDIVHSRIVIVDDQPANLRLLEGLLTQEGMTDFVSTSDPTHVLPLVRAYNPDLILLDLMMPEMSGYQILEALRKQRFEHDFLPVLVLTADATKSARHRALSLGAKDFLTKPFDHVEAMLRIWNLLETRCLYKRLGEQQPMKKIKDGGPAGT